MAHALCSPRFVSCAMLLKCIRSRGAAGVAAVGIIHRNDKLHKELFTALTRPFAFERHCCEGLTARDLNVFKVVGLHFQFGSNQA